MRDYLKAFNILTDDEIETLLDKVIPKEIKKNEFFIKEGATCKEVGFIISGCFRSFYYSSSGEEVTYCFSFQNSFITAYSSFIAETKTQENIQALCDVKLLSISKEVIKELENNGSNWLKLFKLLAEQEYIKIEKRIFLLQKESAERKYQDLLDNHPEYLKMIPLSYLASYLGITQRHLSRIRKTLSKN